MREVIVEHIGGVTRTIKVGIDWDNIKVKTERRYIKDLICSPRILSHNGSDTETPKSRSWKTTKRGNPHAKRGWQRHPDRQPSCRRNRWGHVRSWIAPSARMLNEMGRCIYPCVDLMDYLDFVEEEYNDQIRIIY